MAKVGVLRRLLVPLLIVEGVAPAEHRPALPYLLAVAAWLRAGVAYPARVALRRVAGAVGRVPLTRPVLLLLAPGVRAFWTPE